MRISDWSSDVCSSDLRALGQPFLDGAYWTIAYEVMFYGWVFVFITLGWFKKYWQAIVVCWLALSVANELRIDISEERRVGTGCVSTCRSRRSTYHSKKKYNRRSHVNNLINNQN